MTKQKGFSVADLISQINSAGGDAATMDEMEEQLEPRCYFDTGSIILNTLISANPYGGLPSNRSYSLLGEFSSGKSLLTYIIMKSAVDQGYVVIYIDTEGDVSPTDLKSFGIDTSKVLILKGIYHVEALKFRLRRIAEDLQEDQLIFPIIDSIGNMPSKKEFDGALEEDEKADMTRAKQIGSMFRVILKQMFDKGIPSIFINRQYENINASMFTSAEDKKTTSGGKSTSFSPSISLELSRKDIKEVVDYINEEGKKAKKSVTVATEITIKNKKNRLARRGATCKIKIDFKTGLDRYSGLLEFATAGGFVEKVHGGWMVKGEEKRVRGISNKQWNKLLKDGFADYLTSEFSYPNTFDFGNKSEIED